MLGETYQTGHLVGGGGGLEIIEMVWLVSISSDTLDSIKRFVELYKENQELDNKQSCDLVVPQ